MTLGGISLRACSSRYKDYGMALAALGACMNHYWPRDEKEASDLPLFSMVSHLFAQHESHMQWDISHQFSMENSKDNKTAREQDTGRAEEQLEYSRKADRRAEEDRPIRIREAERGEEQLEYSRRADARAEEDKSMRKRDAERAEEQLEYSRKADDRAEWDKKFKLKEARKQSELDWYHGPDISFDSETRDLLRKHGAYIEDEIEKVQTKEENDNDNQKDENPSSCVIL